MSDAPWTRALIAIPIALGIAVVAVMTLRVGSTDRWDDTEQPPGTGHPPMPALTETRWQAIMLDGVALDELSTGRIVVKATFIGAKIPPQVEIDRSAFGRCASKDALYVARQRVMPDRTVPWAFAYIKTGCQTG